VLIIIKMASDPCHNILVRRNAFATITTPTSKKCHLTEKMHRTFFFFLHSIPFYKSYVASDTDFSEFLEIFRFFVINMHEA